VALGGVEICASSMERGVMPTYVTLINWTDQGVRNFKDTVDRSEAAQAAMSKAGVSFKEMSGLSAGMTSSGSSRRRTIRPLLLPCSQQPDKEISGRQLCPRLTPARCGA